MENILEVNNLCKDYDGFSLKDVNFKLERGYIMGFIGQNGAGKTTTIKLIMNLINRKAGEIKIFGLDNIKNEKEVKEKIGFVYDETYCYEDLSLIAMKNIIARFYKNWDDTAFNKYIADFNLPRNKKIKELSKGMKIKYSLAIALSHRAELIIMDEPTSGLDPVFRSELLEILSSIIQDENKSVFFSTHITTDLEKVADYITFINDGKIVFSDSKDSILEKYKIVKGDNSLINDDTKKAFLGIKQNSFGFNALTDDEKKIKNMIEKILSLRKQAYRILWFTLSGGDKMLNLIVKDFILLNRDLIKQALLWVVFIIVLQFLGASAVYIGIPVVMTLGVFLSSCGFGEKNNVDILISSLPVNGKEVVLSKYLSALIFLCMAIVLNTVFSTAIKLTGFTHINRFINIEDISVCLVFIVIYVSIYIPIYLLFGYSKTRMFGDVLQCIVILGLIFVIMIFTFAYNGTAASYIMSFFSKPYFKLIMCTLCLASSIIIVSISMFISLKIYINREL